MSDVQRRELETACRDLVAAGGAIFRWSWDGRMGAALTTFSADRADEVAALLGQYLGDRWDHATIGQAPAAVRGLVNGIGGVRHGQWLVATDAARGVLAVAVWWPWNNGQTISVRVFPVAGELSPAEQESLAAAFPGWFGV